MQISYMIQHKDQLLPVRLSASNSSPNVPLDTSAVPCVSYVVHVRNHAHSRRCHIVIQMTHAHTLSPYSLQQLQEIPVLILNSLTFLA